MVDPREADMETVRPEERGGVDEAEHRANIELARHEALSVIEPALAGIERIETAIGVPLVGNYEVRSEGTLPPGVVLASLADLDEIRAAERVITDKEVEWLYVEMAKHGIGRESDITLAEVGLPADALIGVEGGLLTSKLQAQKELVLGRGHAGLGEVTDGVEPSEATGDIVQFASPSRPLNVRAGEPVAAARLVAENPEAVARSTELLRFLGVDAANPENEWDAAVLLWLTDAEFVPTDEPRVIGVVDVNGAANGAGVYGRLIEIGSIRGRKVYAQEIPRTLELDPETGEPVINQHTQKQVYIQPNSSQLVAAHAELLGAGSAAVATSTTYLPETIAEITETTFERAVAGQAPVRVATIAYGTARLAAVKGTATPERPSLAQALGGINKARRMYDRAYRKVMSQV